MDSTAPRSLIGAGAAKRERGSGTVRRRGADGGRSSQASAARAGQPGRVIAVISTDPVYLDLMQEFLVYEGFRPIPWSDGKSAYDMICREHPAVVVLDLWLEHRNAGEMILGLMRLAPDTRDIPVIACTTDVKLYQDQADFVRDGPCELLLHPLDINALVAKIREWTGLPPEGVRGAQDHAMAV